MSLLSSIEARISRLVEGTFGRLSRSHVQPVELARRLVKEMDDHQSASISRVFVPNVYDVYLSPEDAANFRAIRAELCAELGEYLYSHAQREGYALHSRPRVRMREDPDLTLGQFGIATAIDPGDQPPVRADAEAEPAASRTMVFTPEQRQATAVVQLELQTPSGPVPLSEDPVTIGRGRANTVVIHDSSVSREHATIVPDGTGYLVRDLGSTNGVLVNGVQVEERSIRPGDTLLLGNVELRVAQVADR